LTGAYATCKTFYQEMVAFAKGGGFARTLAKVAAYLNGLGEAVFTPKSTLVAVTTIPTFTEKLSGNKVYYACFYLLVLANALANAAIAYPSGAIAALCAGFLSFVVMKAAVDEFKGLSGLFPKKATESNDQEAPDYATPTGRLHCAIITGSMILMMATGQIYAWGLIPLLPVLFGGVSTTVAVGFACARHKSALVVDQEHNAVVSEPREPSILHGVYSAFGWSVA
jgi:hypothetical protein